MKVIEIRNKFGVEFLAVSERPEPVPGPEQVVLKMRAFSLNYRDLLVVNGVGRWKPSLPRIPLSDGVGLVAAIGTGVSRVKMGDRVAPISYYRRKQGHAPGRIRKLVQAYPLTSVLLPAVAPFPVPFKPFVIAQGVFQVPIGSFVVGTFVGRGALFFVEGFLGVRYGAAAREFVLHQKWASLAILLGLITIFIAVRWLPLGRKSQPTQRD
jgi:hypothetical protein